MTETIALLGRQPALGTAELESLYGAQVLQPLPGGLLRINKDPSEIDFSRLGGTIKLAKLLTELNTTTWSKVIDYLEDKIPEHLGYIPEGKIRLGLSVYGLRASVRDINQAGLQLKKIIKQAGRSVRVVPNTTPDLNSAQSLHNQLTGPTGLELVLIKNGTTTLLAQVVQVQDIEAYAARDQARPARDAKVGMLPPKLAQIIINLAAPGLYNTKDTQVVLDPFCGTGVLLQEALLMGYKVYGTDLEPRMVDYSRTNLEWLANVYRPTSNVHTLETGDATVQEWQPPIDLVATETYLGRPFASPPPPEVLRQVIQDVNTLHKKFLVNLATQLPPHARLCLAVPAWKTRSGLRHLPVLDSLGHLGYTRVSFVHAGTTDLVYHRSDQIVARELVVLERT